MMTDQEFREHCKTVANYARNILTTEHLPEFGPPIMAQWDCGSRVLTLHYHAADLAAEAPRGPDAPDQGTECRALSA